MSTLLLSRLPIPHRIAAFALTATFFILVLLGLAHHKNLRGEILDSPSSPAAAAASSSLRYSHSYFVSEQEDEPMPVAAVADPAPVGDKATAESYYIFLQKFPLESSFKMLFHTEVIVCPRETFSEDTAFLNMLDGLLNTLAPSRFDKASLQGSSQTPFAAIEKDQWSKQSEPGCVQLGYGGANCGSGCCGSPHKQQNRNYALSSTEAVIGNAMGDYKELYFYGVSGSVSTVGVGGGDNGISGEEAYKAVCHGHMNAIEMGKFPMCVSNWTGREYNPLTNNCNTYTSTVLKCVYGLSDAKPHLGVSDMKSVTCPSETTGDGKQLDQCAIPTFVEGDRAGNEAALFLE
mmetsp:Transcript_21216/g.46033  ORF Transcript_21216/g.46033 Transcript_21216/m.46033 type:complete len:347 (+) Transcript_21216:156-1196(+)|eukprot:CAMPEP_0172301604 /NCGR_PEP_ID=MMETSP1058-20130122/3453_1 /TAXON_ID=83371 /ORGANISM="Detonula confervacea, Strain CCMP 353" /LENGTH=346 /DNA_ID=CAMNT_0013011775 /DNA_START=77 /DNA_END=1117 /DNA_ORIENTATION=+